MKYAHLEKDTNKILGWYDDDIHLEIPTPNSEVIEEVWEVAININANCYEDGKFIIKDFRTDEEIEKAELEIKINEAKQFLDKSDKKVLPYYDFEDGDNSLAWYIEERSKSREFIRNNQ